MKYVCCILLVVVSIGVRAQSYIWKRDVSRTIDISAIDKSYGSLMVKIAEAVQRGKMNVYSSYDNGLNLRTTNDQLKAVFEIKYDTIQVIDPVTGKEAVVVTKRGFQPDSCHRYRIKENWTYDAATDRVQVQIESIAPVKDVYGDDGVYRGSQSVFKISYKDIVALMKPDEKEWADFSETIMKGYFLKDTALQIVRENAHNGWSAISILPVNMGGVEDTLPAFLDDRNDDTSLCEMMVSDIRYSKIVAWNANAEPFKNALTRDMLQEIMVAKPDTQVVEDVITGAKTTVVTRKDFNYDAVQQYAVYLNWLFDATEGTTRIQIRAVAPEQIMYNDTGMMTGKKTMFWVGYSDVLPMLRKVDEYHPDHTFELCLWNKFFWAGVKKGELKLF